MDSDGQTVTLVGGGRWGRVHASNLSRLLTSRDRVLWVSRHNQEILRDAVRTFPDGPRFKILSDLDAALAARPVAALVVTSADTHAAVAETCLRSGVHTFVEKPLALKASDARLLIHLARDNNLIIGVGLHLLSASYLHHFKSRLSDREIANISIRWFDPANEVRHGESKKTDTRTPIVHDLYPHIWSIVRVLTGSVRQGASSASVQSDGSVVFESLTGSVAVRADCGRNAASRERRIDLAFRDGGSASFDFAQEPGVAMLDRTALPPDPRWGKSPRPAMAEVMDFLKQVSSPSRDETWPHLAANCIDSVTGAESLNGQLR
jgi:predicted dehydrogenase